MIDFKYSSAIHLRRPQKLDVLKIHLHEQSSVALLRAILRNDKCEHSVKCNKIANSILKI